MVPTIRDVAQRAEVSISTVSRVLNKSASVDEAKRKRVQAAAEALGYSPNPNALSLRGQSTGGIGVLLPYIAGDFFSEFLLEIDRTTQESGHFLIVSSSHRNLASFKAVIQGMKHRVDGLIVMSTQVPAETVRTWLPERLPVLFVNSQVEGSDIETVNFDNVGGAYHLTEHLIELGHTRIAFVKGPEGSFDGLARLDGYRNALRAHGIEPSPALEFEGDFSMESGLAAVPKILATDPRPTALFAANDLSAYGALSGLREAGLQVPEDIALAGFDDSRLAQFSSPSLTTVHAPAQEMGQRAIEGLLSRIRGDDDSLPTSVLLPTHVVARESTIGR
ncbi:MAG: LacI family DNA-binding transcriptional regulator [Rubricoccaceae bacterium]